MVLCVPTFIPVAIIHDLTKYVEVLRCFGSHFKDVTVRKVSGSHITYGAPALICGRDAKSG